MTRLTLLVAVLCLTASGCANYIDRDQSRMHASTPSDSPVRHTTDEREADLVLWVTTICSTTARSVTVSVDGVTVVDGDFHVEGNAYSLSCCREHEVVATSATGAELTEIETSTTTSLRDLVLNYDDDDGQGRAIPTGSSSKPAAFDEHDQ